MHTNECNKMFITHYHNRVISLLTQIQVATEAQSLRNFKGWIDQFALSYCNPACLAYDLDGNQLHGLFHHMLKGEHEIFKVAHC